MNVNFIKKLMNRKEVSSPKVILVAVEDRNNL